MAPILSSDSYGKRQVRLVKIERLAARHELRDLTVSITLGGSFEEVYATGDNRGLLTTDAMRNMVYALAGEGRIGAPEEFALALAGRLAAASERIERAEVEIAEHRWDRLQVAAGPSPDAFAGAAGSRTVHATLTAEEGGRVTSGVDGLSLLKSASSRFSGFLRERHTSLTESEDRILATELTAEWAYDPVPVDWDEAWHPVRAALLEEFARHRSDSVQHTAYLLASHVLEVCPGVSWVSLRLPNIHHLPFDLTRFGGAAQNDVFQETTEPFGQITATISRDDSSTEEMSSKK